MAGAAPQMAQAIEVSDRRGCDLFPIDLGDATARRRMASYIWGDMAQRADRQKQALAALKGQVPVIDRADAAGWVAAQIMRALPVKQPFCFTRWSGPISMCRSAWR